MTQHAPRRMVVEYEVPLVRADWLLPEEPVPESQTHDLALDLLKAILLAFVRRRGMSAHVARNLAIRFSSEDWRVGIDPDLCIITPRLPEGDDLTSLRLWEHHSPLLNVEVVSESNARKDYTTAIDRHAASGCSELWIFDPHLAGPTTLGGPFRLQVWRLHPDGRFERSFAGEGPVFSETVGGWLHPIDDGKRLRIADDADGTSFWRTAEEEERSEKERERFEKEHERAEKERERAEKDAALARVEQLEAELARARAEELFRRGDR